MCLGFRHAAAIAAAGPFGRSGSSGSSGSCWSRRRGCCLGLIGLAGAAWCASFLGWHDDVRGWGAVAAFLKAFERRSPVTGAGKRITLVRA